jgi:hypothetical protein
MINLKTKFYQLLFHFLTKIFLLKNKNIFNNYANRKINEILKNRTINIDTGLNITEIVFLKDDRCIKIEMFNNKMLNYSKLYRALYYTLMSSEDFNSFTDYKVVISTAINESKRFNLHNNIIFTKNISVKSFMDKCKLNLLFLNNIDYLG